ncbi:Fe(2+) transporter FeoB [invertebrate metagenome]|uniref:Ferrous iron transport protein B n=1 Tax=invertebrate metagenome TaxID=1711999 RepID=A0A2H9TAA1_9ZZZZ
MSKHIVALVGNPNSGKTTVFNGLTGANQQVGNWPGVTVEKRCGEYSFSGNNVKVVDLPGTYCLDVVDSTVSLDERIARDFILARESELIINIVDGSNLERNLYLTSQLLDSGMPVVIVLNMMDVAAEKGIVIDPKQLEKELKCPVFPVVASRGKGIDILKRSINGFLKEGLPVAEPLVLEGHIEESADLIKKELNGQLDDPTASRWFSLRLLEGNEATDSLFDNRIREIAGQQRRQIEANQGGDMDILMASARYDGISQLVHGVQTVKGKASHKLTEKIDRVVLNRVLGLPIFFGVMYLMFMFSINLGSSFIDFFDGFTGTILVDGFGHLLNSIGAPAWLVTLLANGIGGGIQTVSTFIPVIAFLFLFLSVLEDSGYMARAAFVMDRALKVLGLPGKAFVPMIVGFGCNVPAIMATRTLENEKDRLLTISMAPFMSCGARLPVYALFAAVFFPATGQNVVFILYLVGILAAVFTGFIVRRSILGGESTPFIMELPSYHMPSPRQIVLHTWDRLKAFLVRAGKAIVLVVFVLNVLNSVGTDGSIGNENTESSLLSKIGQTITPVFKPMGMSEDNWPAAVGIFTGILAKEAVVGTLDSMYHSIAVSQNGGVMDAGEDDFDLWAGISDALATIPANLSELADKITDPMGVEVGDLTDLEGVAEDQGVTMDSFSVMATLFPSTASVIAYLLLILLYTPCCAALGAVYRETTLGWTLFVAGWTFLLGYAVSVLYYQFSLFHEQPGVALGWLGAIIVAMLAVIWQMRRVGSHVLVTSSSKAEVPQSCGGSCSCS